MSKRYIHYGSPKFCATAFVPITNFEILNKPLGGLWASPVGAERSWYEWSSAENFHTERLTTSFEFELSPEVRVLELTPENVWELPVWKPGLFEQARIKRSSVGMVMNVDFEALAREYDVLECSLSKYPSLYWSLYGWDCDCILVMNPEVIVNV